MKKRTVTILYLISLLAISPLFYIAYTAGKTEGLRHGIEPYLIISKDLKMCYDERNDTCLKDRILLISHLMKTSGQSYIEHGINKSEWFEKQITDYIKWYDKDRTKQ